MRSDTTIGGEIALVMFFTMFLLVLGYAFSRRNQKVFARAARLPLEADSPALTDWHDSESREEVFHVQ